MSNSSTGSDGLLGAETGFNTDFGVASPGSPADAMGTTVMPPSGGVGGADPAAGEDIGGDTQARDLGIVDDNQADAGASLKPRLVDDIDPRHSNVSGPTNTEEGSNR